MGKEGGSGVEKRSYAGVRTSRSGGESSACRIQEIRSLQEKLVNCMEGHEDQTPEDWLQVAGLTPHFIQAAARKLSVDGLVRMPSSELQDTMRRLSSNSEDRSRLTAALSCLKSETGDESGPDYLEAQQDGSVFSPITPPSSAAGIHKPPPPTSVHGRSISISVVPCSSEHRPSISTEDMPNAFITEPGSPPGTRAFRTRIAKTSNTPPPPSPSQRLLQLLPNLTLPRSKSHESQLAHRIEDPSAHKAGKRNRVLAAIQINGYGNGPEDSALRSPLTSARTHSSSGVSAPYIMPATPTLQDSVAKPRGSPQAMRRDIGLAVTHRFSTKSWLSQTCQVCCKSMMFGVKCKHCKLKCHNKCTKDAPSCRISFLTLPRMRRAESVPSDINNRIDHTAALPLQFGTLPKALPKREPAPSLSHLDSSSNPSSATSSTPSSPAHFQQSNPPSVGTTPPPGNPSPLASRDERFHFPGQQQQQQQQQHATAAAQNHSAHVEGVYGPVDVPASMNTVQPAGSQYDSRVSQVAANEMQLKAEEQRVTSADDGYPTGGVEASAESDQNKKFPTEEHDEDGLEDLPSSIYRRSGRSGAFIARKVSQTSVYLQEWDIPYEQLQLGELIGKGRWGKVHKGRWHGEVAIRLLEIDGTNQDHLKVFKKEVMNYRQTRHENVVLFMGACMAPPHLAIITSFCRGLTLYTVVRERGHMLDINKTRQIAQEIVKGMGYLHAKGIIHKDLKSKNVFYDANKVVITDFGLFGMSGVVEEGRRKNVVRIPRGWICYLAPEIVRRMSPEVDEDQLPFSNAADIYAFGTIWYELQVGDWPITNQPVEAKIWLVGSNEGIKRVLAEANLGKEVTEILSTCWSPEADDRPTFTQLVDTLDRLPKLNRRLSHPGHFGKTPWDLHHHHHHHRQHRCLRDPCHQALHAHGPYEYK